MSVLGIAALGANGQQPSSWTTLSIPNGVQAGRIHQVGKLVIYEKNKRVHVFSSFTRTWQTHVHPSGTQLRYANDWLLIQSGQSFTAFSAMRGTFETITLSSRAVVVNPAAQRNDSILLVQDGGTLHSFSAFGGQWLQTSVATSAVIAVQRNVAVVAEDTQLFGLSAFGTNWVQQKISAQMTTVLADGTVGIAQNDSTIWGFSAQRQGWTNNAALTPGTQPLYTGDVAVWTDANEVLGFSGLRGEFASLSAAGPAQVVVDQQLAVATIGTGTAFFSAPRASWYVFMTSTQPTVSTSAATALLVENNWVHGYSALLGTVTTRFVVASQHDVNWSVAAVISQWTDIPYLFSAFTGQWRAAPVSPRRLAPMTAFNSILVETKTGYSAFSARTGRLVPLAVATSSTSSGSSSTSTAHVDRNSAVIAVETKKDLHVFDARRDVWISEPLSGSGPLSVAIWRTSMIARQGRRCWGFGPQVGEIDRFDLPEPAVNTLASSEVVSVATARYLAAYSPVPDLTTLAQFPEFRRMFADGSVLELQLRSAPGAAAAVLLGVPMATGAPLPYGTFFLSPISMAVLWGGTVPSSGTQVLRLPMPAGLRGLGVAFQAGLLPPGGVYLSRMSTLCVL